MESVEIGPKAVAEELSGRSFWWAIIALAMGGFAIGTTEFVTMGLLPQVASSMRVGIPVAGHVISAYAVGVVIGAPLLAFLGARLPRKGLLLTLIVAFVVGNAASALAGSFGLLTVARFAAGLPHGAYFGVASLVAASLAAPERRGRAVSMVMLGLAVANVVGVPAATWLGQTLGWRSAYWTVTALGLLTLAMVAFLVPRMAPEPGASARRELRAFTSLQVWLTLLVGAIGFGGMFSFYSYIAPTVTVSGGLPDRAVPVFLLTFGVGMTVGTWLGGVLADRSVLRSLVGSSLAMAAALAVIALLAPYGWWMLPATGLVSITSSVLVVNLQLRLMQVAGDAQTIGAALNHASLNLANALGAWLGGLVLTLGFGYPATAWVGVGLSFLGLAALVASTMVHRRDVRRAARTS